jgi:hypothetical protein
MAPELLLGRGASPASDWYEIHRAHVLPRASHERPWEEWARSVVHCLQGRLAAVAREVPARLDEGWARGDHCIVPLWAGGDQLLARLAVGDVEGAERDWARAERAWSSRSFTPSRPRAFRLSLKRAPPPSRPAALGRQPSSFSIPCTL